MIDSDKGHFFYHLKLFAARYPSFKWLPQHSETYWMVLQFFSLEHSIKALDLAANNSPKFIPDASTVRQHAVTLERQTKRPPPIQPAATTKNEAPSDPTAAELWIGSAKTPGERLARKFQAQSKQLNLDPHQPCPPDIARQRMTDILALLSRMGSAKIDDKWKQKGMRYGPAKPKTQEAQV